MKSWRLKRFLFQTLACLSRGFGSHAPSEKLGLNFLESVFPNLDPLFTGGLEGAVGALEAKGHCLGFPVSFAGDSPRRTLCGWGLKLAWWEWRSPLARRRARPGHRARLRGPPPEQSSSASRPWGRREGRRTFPQGREPGESSCSRNILVGAPLDRKGNY